MGKIAIEGMEFYAYHGHFDVEKVVGNKFLVDIYIDTDTSKAEQSDNLDDALDYQRVYLIVKSEMSVKSNLLENVCNRILNRLYSEFGCIESAKVKVSKMNPPMGGSIEKVSLTVLRDSRG